MSDNSSPKGDNGDHEKLGREELLARLREVTEQRDRMISQYEAAALQADESVRDIDYREFDREHSAKLAEEQGRRAEEEAARADDLSRRLDEERRERAELAAAFARFREAAAHPPVDDPWGLLGRALSQILSDWVAWARAKIPQDSSLLPWFDRTVALLTTVGRHAWAFAKACVEWARPRLRELATWVRGEVTRRWSKG